MKSVPCARLRTSSSPKMREKPAATRKVIEPTARPRRRVMTKSCRLIPRVAAIKSPAKTTSVMSRIRCLRRNEFINILCGAGAVLALRSAQITMYGVLIAYEIFHAALLYGTTLFDDDVILSELAGNQKILLHQHN